MRTKCKRIANEQLLEGRGDVGRPLRRDRSDEGQAHVHRRAAAETGALGPDLAAVKLDGVLGDCEAKTGAAAGARLVCLVEALEDASELLGCYPGTGVGDGHAQA